MKSRDEELNMVLEGVRSRAGGHDLSGTWPEHDLRELGRIGAMRWAVPAEFGGEDLDALELHHRYERIAAASVATALILTQRDSAVAMIADQADFPHRERLLRQLCRAESFATVGIAQLTTSRRYGEAALRAHRESSGWRLRGVIPWSTGAARAEHIVAGAVTDDGQQLLFVLQTNLKGVTVDPPMPLVALRSSWTSLVQCEDVRLADDWVLAGPTEKVLGARSKSVPAGQAFIAMGLCRAALDLIAAHPAPQARDAHMRLGRRLAEIRAQLHELCSPTSSQADPAAASAAVRGAVNDLAVRITHAAVALYKGSALLADHPAQRLAREAMFLLVWSCPSPVVDCTLSMLLSPIDPQEQ